MKDGVEQWIRLEGPAPRWIHQYLDAARKIPPMTAEDSERMDRAFVKAVLSQREKQARARGGTR